MRAKSLVRTSYAIHYAGMRLKQRANPLANIGRQPQLRIAKMTSPDPRDAPRAAMPAAARRTLAPPWLARVLIESALIVFSVLLALALDQNMQDRQRNAQAQAALGSIRDELEANLRNLERAKNNHRAMFDSLTRYASLNQPVPERIYLAGIFNPAPTYAVAWESARETGAVSDMPYDLVLQLSRVHAEQSRYRELADALVQDVMMQVRREGAESVLRDHATDFMSLQSDFVNREQHLVDTYRVVLARLDTLSEQTRR